MFLKEQTYRDADDSFKLHIACVIIMCPLMLIYTFILDLIFVLNKSIVEPTINFIKLVSCDKIDLSVIAYIFEYSYGYLFGMHELEVEGFRRMRTISQLTFETLIQLIL